MRLVRHHFTSMPSQRLIELLPQLAGGFDQCVDDCCYLVKDLGTSLAELGQSEKFKGQGPQPSSKTDAEIHAKARLNPGCSVDRLVSECRGLFLIVKSTSNWFKRLLYAIRFTTGRAERGYFLS
jgi:hypothetical protein